MKKKLIIFDFDGTIANTLVQALQILNNNTSSYGVRKIEDDELEKLKGLTAMELIKLFKIPLYRLPFLAKKLQTELFSQLDQVKLFPGVTDALKSLKKRDYHLGIVTSNAQKNVKKFLELQSLDMFDFIHSQINIFGKANTIQSVMKKNKFNVDETIYIGDEVRDIDACKKIGIDVIAVTWGYNTKQLLQSKSPDYIIDTPKELLKIL